MIIILTSTLQHASKAANGVKEIFSIVTQISVFLVTPTMVSLRCAQVSMCVMGNKYVLCYDVTKSDTTTHAH